MKTFCKDRTDVAGFVEDMCHPLNPDSQWTMTITAGKSEDYFALIAIDGLSEDTVKSLGYFFLDEPLNISIETTQDG